MKITLLLLSTIITCVLSTVKAQPYADTVLDRNAVSALLTDRGMLFSDTAIGISGYEVPKGSDKYVIFATSFWFGALDDNNNLRLAAQKFGAGDFYAGPYSSNSSYNSQDYLDAYSPAIWNVSRQQIEAHMLEYSINGFVANPDSALIMWPGNGDGTLGVANDQAPYVDVDNNGIYNPYAGDYPDIKGCETTYIIFNDDAGPHTSSGGEKLGIEVHLMLYQYSTNSYLDTTTFMDMRVVNRGPYTLHDFRTAVYMDADVGNYQDDFTGSDSTRNLMFTYNGDAVDEINGGAWGYDINPPCVAIKCLNDTMENFGYYTGLGGNGYPYTDPGGALEYWNYMHGLWQDGSSWYYGGLGFQGSTGVTTIPTNYMFSGDPETGIGWSEITNGNPPGDRRTFMTVEETVLNPGTDRKIDYVIITGFGGDHLASVTRMKTIADSAQVFYDNFNDFCDDVLDLAPIAEETDFEMYPNPSTGAFHVNVPEGVTSAQITVRDLSGKIILKSDVNSASFEGNLNCATGVYLVTVSTADTQLTKKLIVE